ncbi:MAG TPA: hypothetical protein DIT99_00485 [Candidatus Latescibacteria bacterium]|nr:hypothetical protein [Candidatus Latescibacterota bacterium]
MMDKATTSKRVLVTGSTGAIGQPVCRHLLARGHMVRGFARRPAQSVYLPYPVPFRYSHEDATG